MKKSNMIVVAIIIVAVIAAGAYVLTRNDDKNQVTTTTQTNQTPTTSTSTDQNAVTTITYDGSAFSPSKVTAKAGNKVTIKNDSSNELQLESNPHPAHTDNPELNIGLIAPGKSMTFAPTTIGTWGYHNHLNSSNMGTIIVE